MAEVQRSVSTLEFALPASFAPTEEGTFRICGHVVQPFVDNEELKAHLTLLSVFDKVHESIQKGGVVVDGNNLPITTPAYELALAKIQHRFDIWISRVVRNENRDASLPLQAKELPPADVLMFLHAYMLSPWNFYEDCYRIYPELLDERFPLSTIRSLINTDTLELVPTAEQISHWERCTGTSFKEETSAEVKITCPQCSSEVSAPWTDEEGTGYGQASFTSTCAKCDLSITRDVLCVERFFEDVLDANVVLAHTLLNASGKVDLAEAISFSQAIRDVLALKDLSDGSRFEWRMARVASKLRANLGKDEKTVKALNHVLEAYMHPGQTSLDLGRAALRQARFIREMQNIKWCSKEFFECGNKELDTAIVRYHHYLALNPVSLVPSLDIDLAFHTHQLQGSKYRKDTVRVLGRLHNHDDDFEESYIDCALYKTKVLWEKTYGSPYVPAGAYDECGNGCA